MVSEKDRGTPIRFEGQTALITGVGDLGHSIATKLADLGCHVVRGIKEGSVPSDNKLVGEYEERYGTYDIYSYEASKEGGEALIESVLEHSGTLQVIIHMPDLSFTDIPFPEITPFSWHAGTIKPIEEAFFLCQPAFRVMRENNYGKILFILPQSLLYGSSGGTTKKVASMACIGLMNVTKLEGRKYTVGVNALVPMAFRSMPEVPGAGNDSPGIDPAYITSMMVYLSSKECTESGRIYVAGPGTYAKAAIMTGESSVPPLKSSGPVEVEDVADAWKEISRLDNAASYWDQDGMIGELFEKVVDFSKTSIDAARNSPAHRLPKDEIRFDGRVAIVTGAGEGLGRVYALELALRGALVVVNDYGVPRDGSGEGNRAPADRVVKEIRALGGKAIPQYDSVATGEGGRAIVKTALDAFGKVDILINNAGIIRDKSFVKMTIENWRAVLNVHLNGAFYVAQAAFGYMAAQGYGRILMTTSVGGLYGNFGQSNYGTAKMGLVGLMSALSHEGSPHGIRVNTIAPLAATRMNADVMPEDQVEKMDPRAVAAVVLYLVSDACSATGMIINASAGAFNRAAVVTGEGFRITEDQMTPTPEMIARSWEQLNATKEVSAFNDERDAMAWFSQSG